MHEKMEVKLGNVIKTTNQQKLSIETLRHYA